MRKVYIVIFFLVISAHSAFAQNELTGRVFNKANNKPVADATVYIEDLKTGATTDKDGVYSIKKIPAGNYLISVVSQGFVAVERYEALKKGLNSLDFPLTTTTLTREMEEVVITGNAKPTAYRQTPQAITQVSNDYLLENPSTNVIDALSRVPGVSGITDGQSITKPVIRGLGYNRVLTVDDGVELVDQAWFDEFGIEVDPDKVQRAEILKGPASLAYGSDAIAGVVNLIPEEPLAEGARKADLLFNYQTNNGLINNMVHFAGTQNGISWSGRVDNIMAHAYQNPADGYVLNSQFSNFNADGTIGLHRKWGYTQLHGSYFDMSTGIVDGTRDSATGLMERQVAYPQLNGGAPTYVLPTYQEQTSYTPFVINQRIRHSKIVWDNSLAVGSGRIIGTFSYQKNIRQETNDPTQPNTPDIVYASDALTYDLHYISSQYGKFNFSAGANGVYQDSKSLGTVMLIPNYHFFQIGGFAIGNLQLNKVTLSGGIRYDTRSFTGAEHWIDTTNVAQAPVPPNTPGSFEEFAPFTTNFSGVSGSLGAVYNINRALYLKGNIARGYRAPSVNECAAFGVHDGTVVYEIGDHTLNPETSLQEDLIFGVVTKDVSFEADVFNNGFDNFIYAKGLNSVFGGDSLSNLLSVGGTLFPNAPVYKYTEGKADLYGGEASVDIHPSAIRWLQLYGAVSYVTGGLQNVPDSIHVLPFVPPLRVTAEIRANVGKIGGWLRNGYAKFGMLSCAQQNDVYKQTASYTALNTEETPHEYAASQAATAGYTIFNAGIGGDILNYKGKTVCRIFLAGTNIFNTIYMDYMSRFKYYPYNNANGRVGVFNMGQNFSIKILVPLDLRNGKPASKATTTTTEE
jgi:iron complex outermembrane recepter protein